MANRSMCYFCCDHAPNSHLSSLLWIPYRFHHWYSNFNRAWNERNGTNTNL